jgi:hypothetical protein
MLAAAGAAHLCYWAADMRASSASPTAQEAVQQQALGQQQQQAHALQQQQFGLAHLGGLPGMGSMQLLQPHLGGAVMSSDSWGAAAAAQPSGLAWGDL